MWKNRSSSHPLLTAAAMSLRPYRGSNRNQWRSRSFSNHPPYDDNNSNHHRYHSNPPHTHYYPQLYHHPRGQSYSSSNPYYQQQQHLRPRKPATVSDYRNWEHAKPGPPPACEKFRVVSYNILADYLAIKHRTKLYSHIPPYILDWEFRKRNILFELGLWSPDVLCFQEVDRFRDFEQELNIRGYTGLWKMRTGEPVDGCAIFWRSSRFKLLHEEAIEFNKFGLRDNVAQICVLESLNEKSSMGSFPPACSDRRNKVVVCNIHVLYNPKRGEIKLGQVRLLLDRAYATSKLWDDAPVVLCGDFNSTPKSSLYNFIAGQKLIVSELPRDKISGQYSGEIHPKRQFTSIARTQSTANATRSYISTHVEPTSASPDLSANVFTNMANEDEKADSQLETKIGSERNVIVSSSPNELHEAMEELLVGEDSTSFLSELHGPDGAVLADSNDTSEPQVLDGSLSTNGEAFVEGTVYDPSGWTPKEIEAATGSSGCTTIEHLLTLRSTYSEIEDYSGTRDTNGEPQVTSYHRGFQGTVDYIWRSEGLQTVRVLAPIPKQAMQWTPGFPTKVLE
uniref:carbon catabolite repressor protein 4 homolog 6 isoform X2 n=1 Tax=Erigeron canadensis TaxID=72917 RepID=UPI001CB8B9F4|nr:carbon catabolite repressor protein 4 homolog 6 isoform X2 [Erigeron canadensis]